MNKLINYIKQGKGRGLRTMLIFSVLATLLTWGTNYSKIEQTFQTNPDFSSSYIWGLHLAFISASLVGMWLLYIIVVGLSTFFSWVFRLKLSDGVIWRSTTISLIGLFLFSLLLSIVGYLFVLLGEIALLFYPLVMGILTIVLLDMLIVAALAEPKETKKKK